VVRVKCEDRGVGNGRWVSSTAPKFRELGRSQAGAWLRGSVIITGKGVQVAKRTGSDNRRSPGTPFVKKFELKQNQGTVAAEK